MKKVIGIISVLFLFVFLTGFQKAGDSASIHGDMGEIAGHDGIAVEVIAVEGYTYVELDSAGKNVWIAAPTFKVEKGDRVLSSKGLEMRDFTSKILGRTFPEIWFVGTVEVVSKDEVSSQSDKAQVEAVSVKTPVIGTIKKVKDGYSLEEIFNRKKELAGKELKFRAKIVKVSGTIMGNEWYHVQDGTGSDAVLDLIVTSKDRVKAGSIVLVSGTLGVNRDFGSGYRYDVIVENATIKVE